MRKQDAIDTVEKAALWLDKTAPGWADRINKEDLNLRNEEKCIIGQIFGDYKIGKVPKDLQIIFDPVHLSSEQVIMVFNSDVEPKFVSYNSEEVLNKSWLNQINKRV